MNKTEFAPQQTSPVNCTIFAAAWAIEECLRQAGPEYARTIDRHYLERLVGEVPCMPSTVVKLVSGLLPGIYFVPNSAKIVTSKPTFFAYSGDGYAHSLAHAGRLVNGELEVYDPAIGALRFIELEKLKLYSGDWVTVVPVSPTITRPWMRFALVRFFARLFGIT